MLDVYAHLITLGALSVIAAIVFYLLEQKTKFITWPYMVRQIIIGVVFGGIAIVSTEWGVPLNGAMLNCRDAAVLTSGLIFGAPSGIIAGLLAGIERYIAVAWGIGAFTQVACSVSTIVAGFFAAALRKLLFDDKKPSWVLSLVAGIVMEDFHMIMIFITNMSESTKAMGVVVTTSKYMIISNGLTVFLAAIAVSILAKDTSMKWIFRGREISQQIQRWLFVTVACVFAVTTAFVFNLQNNLANKEVKDTLTNAMKDVGDSIRGYSDRNLLKLAYMTARHLDDMTLADIAAEYSLTEVSVIDKNGIIVRSSVPKYVGWDMRKGEQSAEFLCLLSDNVSEYVQSYQAMSSDETVYRKYAGVNTDEGFVQVGYNAEQFQADLYPVVSNLTMNKHVGQTGRVIAIDQNGDFVGTASPVVKSIVEKYGEELFRKPEKDVMRVEEHSGDRYVAFMNVEGYTLVANIPVSEALEMRDTNLYVNTFLEMIVFAILFILVYLLIKRIVVTQIKEINHSLSKITGGDLEEIVDVRNSAEFASLSDDINSTVDTLKRYISEAEARIDAELEFAKDIQASSLPSTFPAFPNRMEFDIYASMNPAKEVGGDFYDFYLTENDRLNFLVADVSGKGIPAAMFMMRAKTALKSLTENGMLVSDVFTEGNASLCEGNDAGMFVTAWQGGIDLLTGTVRFANAGHNPPVLKRNGKYEYLKSRAGFVLAGMDGLKYKLQEFVMEPGDEIFLYTDGVTEATNAENALYGEDRLLNILNAKEYKDMEEVCKTVKADVDAFVGDAPQFDDITMVALRFRGLSQAPTIHFDETEIKDITAITEFVENELEKIGCNMKTIYQINIAIDELVSNIVKYGYRGKKGPVTVKVIERLEPHSVYVRFEDEGIPYNPLANADPDVTLSADEREVGGLGIYMVKQSMDSVKYKYENDKNILTIKKDL